MKLSIIIPVYLSQDTLDRCVESILQQSFTDYELILVDDESPDNSPKLCDEYAKRDERISVIHKMNGGLSDARNAGIKQAKGDYITFVDSDDAIEENTLQPLIDELTTHQDIDLLEYPIIERIGHPHREHLLTFCPKEYTNSYDYWLGEQVFYHSYACNKIFRRCLFENISFPKGKNFEDVHTIPYLIGLIPNKESEQKNIKIRVTNVGCYLYYWNSSGITAKAKYDDMLCLYNGLNTALVHTFNGIADKDDVVTKYKQPINVFLTQILNILLDLYEIDCRYENCKPLMDYTLLMKNKGLISGLKLKLLLTIGYKRLCTLNRLLHKIYRHQS